MVRMKIGGMILTGFGAFLIVNKLINVVDNSVKRACEASKWRAYYKSWSEGEASGEPIAPGYSVTTRPIDSDKETVYDPTGADHDKSNQQGDAQNASDTDVVNAIVGAVKDVAEKAMDSLKNRAEGQEGASEGQTEVSEEDKNDIANKVLDYMEQKWEEAGDNVVYADFDKKDAEEENETVD